MAFTTRRIALGLTLGLLGIGGFAPAARGEGFTVTRNCLIPSAPVSGMTERLQYSRYTVIAVDPVAHRVRLRGDAGAAWDIACRPGMVRDDDDRKGGVLLLGAGDIVAVSATGKGGVAVLRRSWQELTSPER